MNGHEGVRVNGNQEASFAYAFLQTEDRSCAYLYADTWTLRGEAECREADRTYILL